MKRNFHYYKIFFSGFFFYREIQETNGEISRGYETESTLTEPISSSGSQMAVSEPVLQTLPPSAEVVSSNPQRISHITVISNDDENFLALSNRPSPSPPPIPPKIETESSFDYENQVGSSNDDQERNGTQSIVTLPNYGPVIPPASSAPSAPTLHSASYSLPISIGPSATKTTAVATFTKKSPQASLPVPTTSSSAPPPLPDRQPPPLPVRIRSSSLSFKDRPPHDGRYENTNDFNIFKTRTANQFLHSPQVFVNNKYVRADDAVFINSNIIGSNSKNLESPSRNARGKTTKSMVGRGVVTSRSNSADTPRRINTAYLQTNPNEISQLPSQIPRLVTYRPELLYNSKLSPIVGNNLAIQIPIYYKPIPIPN